MGYASQPRAVPLLVNPSVCESVPRRWNSAALEVRAAGLYRLAVSQAIPRHGSGVRASHSPLPICIHPPCSGGWACLFTTLLVSQPMPVGSRAWECPWELARRNVHISLPRSCFRRVNTKSIKFHSAGITLDSQIHKEGWGFSHFLFLTGCFPLLF